jgi:hypothetical protein
MPTVILITIKRKIGECSHKNSRVRRFYLSKVDNKKKRHTDVFQRFYFYFSPTFHNKLHIKKAYNKLEKYSFFFLQIL